MDDTALIADCEEKLQRLLNVVTKESERLGLELDCEQMYVMVASRKAQALVCNVTVNSMQIEQVNHFKYLGSWITSDGRSTMDIKCRIGQAKQTFMDMRNVVCARNLGFPVRMHLLQCYIWPVVLYGCESRTLSKTMGKKLEVAEMWFWRKIMRISWIEKLTNEVVLDKVGGEREFLTTIKRRQWRLIGHGLRGGGTERNILEAEMAGKRARGRQRLKMLDWMMDRLRVEVGKQLANVARDRKNGMREHCHDSSTVFDAMALEEDM